MTDSKALIERLRAKYTVTDEFSTIRRPVNPDGFEAADHIEKLEADNALLREALEDFVACVGVSDDPDILMVDACAYENATRVLGLQK